MTKKVVLITLLPDDYNGVPMVYNSTPPDTFEIPSEDDVFGAWSEAGYNAYNMGDGYYDEDENGERIAFEEYGNSPIYYSGYLIVHSFGTQGQLDDAIHGITSNRGTWRGITPEEFCDICLKLPEIHTMVPIGG